MNQTLVMTSYVLVALSPLPVFVLGYAFYRRSQKPIGKVPDFWEFKYQVDRNEFERRSGIAVMAIGLVIWLCQILYRLS